MMARDAMRHDWQQRSHKVGGMLLLDGAQCVGGMPMNIVELGADFLVASGYKWLLGPYGMLGFFLVGQCKRVWRR